MRPIGLIHSPLTDPLQTPVQAARSSASGQVEVYPEYAGALEGRDESAGSGEGLELYQVADRESSSVQPLF